MKDKRGCPTELCSVVSHDKKRLENASFRNMDTHEGRTRAIVWFYPNIISNTRVTASLRENGAINLNAGGD